MHRPSASCMGDGPDGYYFGSCLRRCAPPEPAPSGLAERIIYRGRSLCNLVAVPTRKAVFGYEHLLAVYDGRLTSALA
jgi:hypothetical protein